MKNFFALSSALFALALCAPGATTLSTGMPNLGSETAASGTQSLSPQFGILVNFDTLTPGSAVSAAQFASQGVSSISDPSGLTASLYSQQSYPVWLTSNGASTDTTITFAKATNIVGIGLGGDGSTPVTLEALSATGSVLGDFTGLVPNSASNPDNAYYVITDTTSDIKSLVVMSGQTLGMDDLQFTPEPGTFALMGFGALLAFARLRKRAS